MAMLHLKIRLVLHISFSLMLMAIHICFKKKIFQVMNGRKV